jgi:hypothetical protein
MLKRIIAIGLIATVAAVVLPTTQAYAGDKEWATAGKILAGVAAAVIVHEVATADRHDERVIVTHRYYGEPASTVRRVHVVRSPQRVWVPGYYQIREERIWIEGCWEQTWVPAIYKQIEVTRYDNRGRAYSTIERVLISEGHYEGIWHEGYWETHEVREWVPGHWEYR